MLREIDPLPAALNFRDAVLAVARSPCVNCHLRKSNFCGALFAENGDAAASRGRHRSIAARQNIYRAGETSAGVLAICAGWAVRFVQLPDGKRQILSLLLPGDLVSPAAILERQFAFSVQAVTEVRACAFPPAEVAARLVGDPALLEAWFGLAAAELRDADRRLVDLGQRTARERIAALLVDVMLRCEQRGEFDDGEFPFPLSQQQIADFTGLTPVHTCRVLGSLRNNGICDVGRGVVKIMALAELQRLASLR